MKHIKVILLLVFSCIYLSSEAQTDKRKQRYGIGFFHEDSVDIHGLSLGLWTTLAKDRYTNTNGFKFELIGVNIIFLLAPGPVEFDTKRPLSETINGLSLSVSGGICDCKTNGLTIGGFGNYNRQVNGLSIAGAHNLAYRHDGVMISTFFNETKTLNGVQIGPFNDSDHIQGVQLGAFNDSEKAMTGLQIGLFNRARDFKGIQIGLWNVNNKRKLPFINWNFGAEAP